MSIIKIYNGDTVIWSEQFPAWSFKALQKLARNWMRYTNGERYTIDAAGIQYQSKTRKTTN